MPDQGRITLWRYDYASGRSRRRATDEVAVEEPLEIQVDTRPVSVTMRTPGHDKELAAGFLVTEGILSRADQIQAIQAYPRNKHGNAIGVFLKPEVTVDFARLTRHVFASSSCGLCGKAAIESVHARFPRLPSSQRPKLRESVLLGLPDRMQVGQATFQRTGGLHAAALFTCDGDLLVLREDVGRHNAVDKAIGWGILHGKLKLDEAVLMVSGRASFEIVQKALAVRIPIIASVSAPSSLAVDFAVRSRQTLIGFLRGNRFNVYAGASRLQLGRSPAPGRTPKRASVK